MGITPKAGALRSNPPKLKGPFLNGKRENIANGQKPGFSSIRRVVSHAALVLMRGYAIASTNDAPGKEWVSYEAAMSHLATVENMPRANSKISHRMPEQVMEAGAAVRTEWATLAQNRPELNLSTIIENVAHRHAIWPLSSEFTKVAVKGRGKWPNDWSQTRPFDQSGKGECFHTLKKDVRFRKGGGVTRGGSRTNTTGIWGSRITGIKFGYKCISTQY